MTTFTVSAINKSMYPGTFIIFQEPENSFDGKIFPLVWMAEMCYPQNTITFKWILEYAFSWAKTGSLVPGVNYMASQIMNTNPNNLNTVILNYDGYFSFQGPNPGGQPGSLIVQNSPSVPMNVASVGIAISGSTAYVAQATPNINIPFTPTSKYWIAFGNYQQGEVLNFNRMTNAAAFYFPDGVTSLNFTMYSDGTFSVHV